MSQDQSSPALDLLADIERFLAASGISATAFGARAVNDSHLVHDLRGGRELSAATVDRIRSFMSAERERIVTLLSGEAAE